MLQQLPFEARMDHRARRHPVRLTPRTLTDPARLFRSIATTAVPTRCNSTGRSTPRARCAWRCPSASGRPKPSPCPCPPHNATASRKPPDPHRPVRHRPAQPPPQRQPARRPRPAPARRDRGRPPPTDCSSHGRPPSRCGPDRTGPAPNRPEAARRRVPDPVAGALLDIRALFNPLFTTQIVKGCLPG
ncbi:hypothetical protein ABZY81_38325 [Streptomyces sp. NPDC006514]|uniref:hypothetical protein n=1 Tax=Streptomyces sp. NPDC006514 TaxID=3154308 RepID=UPI0033A5EF4A